MLIKIRVGCLIQDRETIIDMGVFGSKFPLSMDLPVVGGNFEVLQESICLSKLFFSRFISNFCEPSVVFILKGGRTINNLSRKLFKIVSIVILKRIIKKLFCAFPTTRLFSSLLNLFSFRSFIIDKHILD